MASFNLEKEASKFGKELADLLNRTVCAGIRLKSIVSQPDVVRVAYGITKTDLDPIEGIPITLGPRAPTGYIAMAFRLAADRDRRYLMVMSSFMGLFVDRELERPLLHYDYERDKGDGYPEAHLQVCADSAAWDELCAQTRGDRRPFERLHLPVGGRRFRPTLEDLVDFLITEQIADARQGAQQAIEEGRQRFAKQQLAAAVRNDPDTAVAVLRRLDLLPDS